MDTLCDLTESSLRAYQRLSQGADESTWSVRPSPLGGRGLFATVDLRPGDVIFRTKPLVWGPKAAPGDPVCSCCHRRGRVSRCPGGCCLPVCSPECSMSPDHVRECAVVREAIRLPEDTWRLDLLAVVIPIRFLLLQPEEREAIRYLQGNHGKHHGLEVDLVKHFMEDRLSGEDEDWMRQCCCIMDTNAFEFVDLVKHFMKDRLSGEDEDWMRQCCCIMDTNAFEFVRVHVDGSQSHMRGLFPLATMLNNDCSPNSCHTINNQGVMKVFAARNIAAGEEITTSYSALIWSTAARRLNLSRTKHFLCRCARCADPTEFGSLLSCLSCVESDCHGRLLPVNTLQAQPRWLCDSCGLSVSPKQAVQLQAAQGAMLQRLDTSNPLSVTRFLSDFDLTLPPQSQVVQQLKHTLLWQLGHKPGFTYSELTSVLLQLKEQCCRDILNLLDLLRVGFCRMKGLILLELHGSLYEKLRRNEVTSMERQIIKEECEDLLRKARQILDGDASAQKELNDCQKKEYY